MSNLGTKTQIIPSVGMMREPIVICDGALEPSDDLTLELVQRREPLAVCSAQVIAAKPIQWVDYRQKETKDEPDHAIIFRAIPNLLLTTRERVFWADRRPGFESDWWFRVESVGDRIHAHRFTMLLCCVEARFNRSGRKFDEPVPMKGQERLY